ncbi:ABC transporter ATP-binding protein [Cellulomonas sp. PhB143]|uniref:ABC transporter ATP-binding protein n=1 Tax=Cellulomonas sp. PhB143 TaxID=2485186 RepID=UPI000F49046F|nr:ABC transporter ATP-binding protein [Cellulomonas sp. PhB143]ROS78550.1 teichoic acid transport system ATP-binding protein [Cellulomonas sp. PhB143]
MTERGADDEIDFEIDPEDLEGSGPVVTEIGAPSLVVDDLHITYRVFGGKKVSPTPEEKPSFAKRILTSGRDQLGGVREVKAVQGISFVAHYGESIGIVGINGSGKSTLLRAVAGLIPPTQGAVYVSGEPSLLGVNAVLMSSLTGERNIMIGGLALGLTQRQVRERFDEIVEFSGIGDAVYLPMKAYSSGMGARLRFAISSAATPDILMIDEALATGDATFRQKSKERIDGVRENAGTVFLVSHSIATVEAMCARVLWVHKGRLVRDGPADEVCEEYKQFVRQVRERRKRDARAKS